MGREAELRRLEHACLEEELTLISAADSTLAAALGDACAARLEHRGWAVVRADARIADDEADLAAQLIRAAASMAADVDALAVNPLVATTTELRATLNIRRSLGEPAYALLTGSGDLTGVEALSLAVQTVIKVRAPQQGQVMVIHGLDELLRPGRSRFAKGEEALWSIRGVWQRAHGPALLTGGGLLAAMAAEPRHAFYGYGQLHEVPDLSDRAAAMAMGELFDPRADDGALMIAQRLLGHAVWLAPELARHLPDEPTIDGREVLRAWDRLLAYRRGEHHATLRAASRVHRLAVPVLKGLAHGQGPYATLRPRGFRASEIYRALLALENSELIQRVGGNGWRLADPMLAGMLRETSSEPY